MSSCVTGFLFSHVMFGSVINSFAINNTFEGFELFYSSNNILTGNVATGSITGFNIVASNNNTLSNSDYGFEFTQSSYNLLKNNIGQYNGIDNYYTRGSNNNILSNNIFTDPPSTPSFTFFGIISAVILLPLLKRRK